MDTQRSPFLNWTYFHQEKSIDELRQESLMLAMELEDTKLKAQEELKIRDQQISHLKDLLSRAIKDRNHAEENCQKATFEKLLLLQHQQSNATPHSGISSVEEDDPRRGFSPSDCDESIISSPPSAAADFSLPIDRPLPEQGKLLQAVMKAGPLLQTLLLAGPLPQWRHPPPPIDTYQIPTPPVMISAGQEPFQGAISFSNCGRVLSQRKRGFCEGSESSSAEFKYQRVLH